MHRARSNMQTRSRAAAGARVNTTVPSPPSRVTRNVRRSTEPLITQMTNNDAMDVISSQSPRSNQGTNTRPFAPMNANQSPVQTVSITPPFDVNVITNNTNVVPHNNSSSINSMEIESVGSIRNAMYMNLRLATDLVPRFDGNKSCTLSKFIKQSKLAYSRVNPDDRINLLALIRNKIEGRADQLIENRGDPETLDELISILRSSFARSFDVDHAHDELKVIKQEEEETAETYGARVSEILSRGLEAAKEKYNIHETIGVNVVLNNAAITGFTRGLRNTFLSTLISRNKPDSLGNAINTASMLEREIDSRNTLFGTQSNHFIPKQNIKAARINQISDKKVFTCFGCNEPGHIKRNCPNKTGGKWPNPRGKYFCDFCKKPGHTENICYRKNPQKGNSNYRNENEEISHPLNSQGTARTDATRSSEIVARSQPSGLTMKST